MPSPETLAWLAGVGLVATLSQLTLSRALAVADATAVLPFDYSKLIFAAILGRAVFGERARDCLADASAGAGHDGDFALKTEVDSHALVSLRRVGAARRVAGDWGCSASLPWRKSIGLC